MSDYPAAITATNHVAPVPRRIRAFAGVGPGGRDGDQDLGWSYDFPTRDLLPIAGMIAFYNEKVDIVLGGQRLERPETHFFASRGA